MRILVCALLLACYAAPSTGAPLKKDKLRKQAPELDLPDAHGRPVRIAELRGKVVLLDFWATWCAPCKKEIPEFLDLEKKYRSRGLALIGVSMDSEGWPAVTPFMEKMAMDYPVVLGTKRTAYLYGDVELLPLTFLIDRQGRVAAIHSGAVSRKDLEGEIRKLLSPGGRFPIGSTTLLTDGASLLR